MPPSISLSVTLLFILCGLKRCLINLWCFSVNLVFQNLFFINLTQLLFSVVGFQVSCLMLLTSLISLNLSLILAVNILYTIWRVYSFLFPPIWGNHSGEKLFTSGIFYPRGGCYCCLIPWRNLWCNGFPLPSAFFAVDQVVIHLPLEIWLLKRPLALGIEDTLYIRVTQSS